MPSTSGATWGVMIQPWKNVADALSRRIAALAELKPGADVLSLGGGEGRFAVWVAERYQAQVEAVDPDPAAISRGEAAAAHVPSNIRPRFTTGSPARLPHEDGVFDVAVVDLLVLGDDDPHVVLSEAVRVLKPYGVLVALVPVWHESPTPELRSLLTERLGLAAHLLVEWKRWMRGVGLVELAAEEPPEGRWATASRVSAVARGWRIAGLRGVRAALSPAASLFWREMESRRLDLAVVRGVKWPGGAPQAAAPRG